MGSVLGRLRAFSHIIKESEVETEERIASQGPMLKPGWMLCVLIGTIFSLFMATQNEYFICVFQTCMTLYAINEL